MRIRQLGVREFVQRGRRGWADGDAYDMFSYLGPLIADMVAAVRDNRHSYHCMHRGERPKHVEGDACAQDWMNMLTRIEYGLRYYDWYRDDGETLDWEAKRLFEECNRRMKIAEDAAAESFRLLGKWWGAMWI